MKSDNHLHQKITKEYWFEKLSNTTGLAHIPTAKRNAGKPVFDVVKTTVSTQCIEEIKTLCNQKPLAEFTVLLTAFSLLMKKYFSLDNITVSSVIQEEDHAEDNSPLFFQIPQFKEVTFKDLILQMQQEIEQTIKNRAYDPMAIYSELSRRSIDRQHLSEFSFAYETPVFEADFHKEANLGIKITQQKDSKWLVSVRFNATCFNEAFGSQLLDHFSALLSDLKDKLNEPIADIKILSPAEEKAIARALSNPQPGKSGFADVSSVVEAFEQKAADNPDQTAIVTDGWFMTYGELNAKTNQIAAYLKQEYNVQSEEPIALMVAHTGWMMVGMLSILKAGGAYVPIDPQTPKERRNHIFNDASIKTIITEFDFSFNLGESELNLFAIDVQADAMETSGENLDLNLGSDHLVYIVYTSGTTGMPKGVMIENGSLLNYANWLISSYDLTREDSSVLLSSYAFDLGYTSIWGTLLSGATLHLLSVDPKKSGGIMLNYLADHEISFIKTTPSLFYLLLNCGKFEEIGPKLKLRLLLLGGEKIKVDDVRRFISLHPETQIVNHYGPTETTIGTVAHNILNDEFEAYAQNPVIGNGIFNAQTLVLDDQNNLLPNGVYGELCIAGAGLARGYLNHPELTVERFCNHPLEDGQLIYKTGDITYVTNGKLALIGRKDNQLKLRGYRVELGEIEQAVKSNEKISEVFVRAIRDQDDECDVVVYYTSVEGKELTKLKTFLKNYLPDYMLPTHLVHLRKMPVNANGKIDIQALPGYQSEVNENYRKPETPLQIDLVGVWERVLGRKPIGIDDDFFELGGHSLKATQLLTTVHQELKADITLNDVFDFPTIAQLSDIIIKAENKENSNIEAEEDQEYYPISHAQRRLWVIEQFEESDGAYHVHNTFDFEGLDRRALKESLDFLIQKHEILRTSIIIAGGEPKQKVHDFETIDFRYEEHDLSTVEDQAAEVARLSEWERNRSFDLSAAPLFRVNVLDLGNQSFKVQMTIHHIVFDGWSKELFLQEFNQAYTECMEGQPLTGKALDIQYKDYTLWLNRQIADGLWKDSRNYWLEQLGGEIPILALPTDHKRPAMKSYNGEGVTFLLDQSKVDALNTLCQKEGATLFMGLLSMVKMLLFRYTGQNDLIVGSPIAGRYQKELEDQLGYYANTLALRSQVNAEDNFIALLNKVKETTLNAYQHQAYPFDLLVEELNLTRDLSRTPLFDVMVLLQNLSEDIAQVNPELREDQAIEFNGKEVNKFDLIFTFRESTEGVLCHINYNTDLYEQKRILNLISHFSSLFDEALASSDESIIGLDYLGEEELLSLLAPADIQEIDYPKNTTIQALFEAQVVKNPEAIALVYEDKEICYRELNEQANQLAHLLRKENNIQPDDLVALMVDRSEWMLISILAILKAGGAYVPIDPDYPIDRINYILKDANPKVLIHDNSRLGSDETAIEELSRVNLTQIKEQLNGCPTDNPTAVNRPNDLAYVIYTSGSSGLPKGVLIEHNNVIRLMRNDAFQFDFSEKDCWTLFHSICFDFSVWEMYGALLYGGKLVIVPKETAQNAMLFAGLLSEHGVTVLNQIPGVFNTLVNEILSHESYYALNLRYVIFGGEALNPSSLREWKAKYPSVRLVNMYGITETTVHNTYKEIVEEDIENGLSNIGTPIPTVNLQILDSRKRLVPKGIVGEIAVGGLGVARGYLNRPELTDEKFITHPYSPAHRLYLSGDLGLQLENDELVYMGRKDFQVKIRGYRIELGEIENTLINYDEVSDAKIISKSDANQDNYLIGYYTGVARDQALLRKYLASHLPSYMVPSFLVHLDEFPLTANGKVDTKSLPDPDMAMQPNAQPFEAPSGQIEKQLAWIWEKILGRENLGVNDNFFDMGGNSLTASRLVTHIYKDLNLKINLRTIFNCPTIAMLAAELDHIMEVKGLTHPEEMPLTSFQKQMWMLDEVNVNNTAKNVGLLTSIEGALDVNKLQQAHRHLQQKFPVLRTEFVSVNGELLQKIGQEREEAIPTIQLKSRVQLTEAIDELIQQPIRLKLDPLFKLVVFETGDGDHHLVMISHAILLDKHALNQLNNELLVTCDRLCQGLEPLHNQTSPQFIKDLWEGKLTSTQKEKRKTYWKEVLEAERPDLNFMLDHQPSEYTYEKGVDKLSLPSSALSNMSAISDKLGVDTFTIVTAVVNFLIFRYTGRKEYILWTSEVPEECLSASDPLIGPYEYTLPLIQKIEDQDSLADLLKKTGTSIDEAHENKYPLENMLEVSQQISEQYGRLEVMVNRMTDQTANGEDKKQLKELKIIKETHLSSMNNAGIVFDLVKEAEGLDVKIEFNKAMIPATGIRRLIRHMETILEQLPSLLSETIATAEYLPNADKAQLIPEALDTPSSEEFKTFIEKFQAQVKNSPKAIAASYEGNTISYSALNKKANQLAHFLNQDLLVAPEEMVGILMNKSTHSLIAALAVLKSGGAFVPIDGALPQSRMEEIGNDAGIRVIISERNFEKQILDMAAHTNDLQAVVMMDNFHLEANADQSTEDSPQTGVNAITFVDHKALVNAGSKNLSVTPLPDQLAYCIYTSGSTGKQKGVLIEHGNLLSCFEAEQALHQLDHTMVACHSTNYAFDVSLLELLLPLTVGGRVAIPEHNKLQQNPDYLLQFISEEGVTDLQGTPTFINSFFVEPLEDQKGPTTDLKDLQRLWIGGESLTHDLVDRLKKQINHVSVNNHYGPTEITIDCLSFKDVNAFEKNILGQPLSNSKLYILDDRLQVLPVGIVGEIAIGGQGVGRGYLNQEQMTNEKYVDCALGLIYRTGDFGYLDEQGDVVFLGRRDDQVKIRGHRIALGEIQKVITDHPKVSSTCVQVVETKSGDKELAAYIQLGGSEPLELWPCIGTYPIYDDFLYHMMANDTIRNTQYEAVINSKVKDKVVLEIGPGAELVLTLMCIKAGAKKVYAVEWSKEAFEQASKEVARLGLQEQIILIHGNALEVDIPEKVDFYISEQIGDIGSAEGAISLNNHALKYIDQKVQVIPQQCITQLAAVQIEPHETIDAFNEVPAAYAKKIFDHVGNEFDLRVLLKNLNEDHLISDTAAMEVLDFTAPIKEEDTITLELNIQKDGYITGFSCWVQLYVDDQHMVDSLKDTCNWLPVYLPVFDESVAVEKSDRIKLTVSRVIGDDGYHADYVFSGLVLRGETEVERFEYVSKYQSKEIEQNSFYARLFKGGIEQKTDRFEQEFRQYLQEKLPRYMVPTDINVLKKLPLTSSGKVDKENLKRLTLSKFNPSRAYGVSPKHAIDQSILTGLSGKLTALKNAEPEPNHEETKLLTARQKEIIDKVNDTRVDYDMNVSITQLFEQTVDQYPSRTAIICDDRKLTYEQLNGKVNQLVHLLAEKHALVAGMSVAVIQERSEQLIVTVLALMKLGVGYLVLDKELPKDRILFMLKDSNADLLISDDHEVEIEMNQLILSHAASQLANQGIDNPNLQVDPGHFAYTMYTSGSTGQPKGVRIRQDSVLDYCLTFKDYFNICEKDVVVQQASFSFDTVVEEVFPALISGASLLLMPQGGRDIDALMSQMTTHQATVLSTTPLVINELNMHHLTQDLSLRLLISGGDVLKPTYLDKLITQLDIYNTYGPTESTVCATFGQITDLDHCTNIGFPIKNHQIFLLNNKNEQVAIGERGEIYIGGSGLAVGYLNQPEQTGEYFVKNPYDPDSNLYRTGDMAHWNPDGSLTFLGRKDNQIKVNGGYRVELGEVEQIFSQIRQVKDAAVVAYRNHQGNNQMLAYYTLSDSITKEVLKTQLSQKLPMYMVPHHLIELNDLPRSTSGKVDKKVLELMTLGGQKSEGTLLAPRNYIEKAIVRIWNQVLHIDQISVDANFFDLGGHSIRAARISAMLYDHFQVKISIKDIFNNPTVEQLAKAVQEAEELNFGYIEALEEQEYYQPSHAQKRMWILDQIERDGISAYNMPFVWEMEGLDFEIVEKSFVLLLQRHESLRTTFVTIKGEPKQKVQRSEDVTFKVKYIDLRNHADKDAEARKLVNAENVIPFDLEKGPLLRCSIIQLDDEKQLFLLTLQHTIGDAWSMEVFENNFKSYYNALLHDQEHDLVPLTIQYRDYSAWQNNFLELGNGKEDQNYWVNQFSDGVPILQFPHDLPRPKVKTYNGDIIGEMLPPEFGEKLNEVSQQLSVSVTMLFMAAVKAFLYKYTGQHDLTIGSPIIGRDSIELENQIGFYANTLAIRTRFEAEDSFERLVYKVRENILDGFDHQLYPFDKLVEDLNFQRDLSRSPLFDIMVIHHNVGTGDEQKDLDGIEVRKFLKEVQRSKFDLTFNFADAGEEILFSVNYNTDLFTRARVERVMSHFKELLVEVLGNLEKPLNQIDYLNDQEKRQIVEDFNDNEVPYDTEKLVHEFFEEQVDKNPEAIAVKFEDSTLSYEELNTKANQLAHYLRSNYQIEEDSLVGVMITRTDWLPVVLLGILKAGAAYVPVDPDYPVARNKAILQDASIVALISEKEILYDKEYSETLENISTIDIGSQWKEIAAHKHTNPEKITSSEGLFYLVYTSGSTGTPKAVAITHRNILSFLAWSQKEYEASDFEVTFATTSYCFDLSVYEMFFTFSLGLPVRVLKNGAEIDRWLPEEQKVLINTVPSVIQSLLERQVDFSPVSVLNMAGEPIPYAIKEQLDPLPIEIRNIYGPSEYASGTSCYRFSPDSKEILIGKPLANTEILILDEQNNVLPIGIKGEIYIGGDNLTRGYLNQPELTHDKYVDHPFTPGKKLFKSGDIGRWNDSGNIEFFGRKDNQVKLRGYRIELGEIESAVNLHPSVEMSIAEVKQNEQNEAVLVGYYSGKETETSKFREFLENKLPSHMIPVIFIHMTTWELTPNGKVDRKRLPAPQGHDFNTLSEYKAPENELQEKLVNIWKEVLKLEKVGILDNFFECGGHSLNATQIISRIFLEFGVDVKLNLVFSYPTIEEMSLALQPMINLTTDNELTDADNTEIDSIII